MKINSDQARKRLKTVSVRPASLNDGAMLLAWRNDPTTRAMSANTDLIAEAGHFAWFEKIINNQDVMILIGQKDKISVGMLRFDRKRDDLWEININVAPLQRGKGLGRALLQSSLSHFYQFHPAVSLLAQVKPTNTPSQRIFSSLQFALNGIDSAGLLQFVRLPELG